MYNKKFEIIITEREFELLQVRPMIIFRFNHYKQKFNLIGKIEKELSATKEKGRDLK